jgi:hypothetical protein
MTAMPPKLILGPLRSRGRARLSRASALEEGRVESKLVFLEARGSYLIFITWPAHPYMFKYI